MPAAIARSVARPVASWWMAKEELIPLPERKLARTLVPDPLGATRITSTKSGAMIPVCSR
jgi:hypothetical protein